MDNTNVVERDSFSLDGEVALITGGGSGIGLAIAQEFILAGAKVAICGRRESVLKQASEILGNSATYVVGDITIAESRTEIISITKKRHGPVSLLVNNAGQNVKEEAASVDDVAFDEMLKTHVNASFSLSRMLYPDMSRSGKGSILFISSMAALLGIPLIVGYSTAKSALHGMTRSLASEWSVEGIRVNTIIPGWIETGMTRKAFSGDPQRRKKVISRTPMKKLGTPRDIAMASRFLCSDAASFITGQCIAVDGGASIGF